MFYVLAVVFFCNIFFFSRKISDSVSDHIVNYFFLLVGAIIPSGYLLSELNQIANPLSWGLAVFGFSLVEYVVLHAMLGAKISSFKSDFSIIGIKKFISELTILEKVIFGTLATGFAICSLLNIYALFFAFPNEWDSMTGHLAKCAYYLQNGNMDRMQGTTWTIDFYPNALPTLQIFFYHVFGEKGFKVIHFLSYWVMVAASYKISLHICQNKKVAVFIMLITALLPTALIQATTTETDIVFSAYLSVLIIYLLKFLHKPSSFYLNLIGIVGAIWLSHKVTFIIVAPSVAILALYVLYQQRSFFSWKNMGIALGIWLVAIAVYVLPNGYVANVKEVGELKIGSLSAPKLVMSWHGIEHLSASQKLENFKLSLLRYTSDFIHLDGIRSSEAGAKLDEQFRKPIDPVFKRFNVDTDKYWAVHRFQFRQDGVKFYRERPYWGWIGIGMVLPALFLFGWSFIRKKQSDDFNASLALVFFFCGVIHFLSLSLSAVYDPIKARYFMNMAIWFLPLIAYLYKVKAKPYLIASSIIVVVSAVSTLLFRDLIPLVGEKHIGNLSRIEQLLLGRPMLTQAYEKFDEIVPKDAVVALGTQQEQEDFEYPLWGKDFQRTLIPLHPFRSAVKPIPEEAEYLFYANGVIPYQEGDIKLNEEVDNNTELVNDSQFFLRKLK